MLNSEIRPPENAIVMESRPHLSLGMMGTVYVFLVISLVALMIGLFFARVGAWPVLVYTLIVLMALRLGFQHVWMRSGDYERLCVEEDDLLVEICQSGKKGLYRFNRYWANVKAEHSQSGVCTHLTLSIHGKHVKLGRYMNSDQRLAFAQKLKFKLISPR